MEAVLFTMGDSVEIARLAETIEEDVKKTKEMEKLDYICYETPSGKGTFYNITFQLNEEKGYFVGTFGCDQKQKETMGVLLEAMVQQINDDRKEEGGNHSGSDYL